MTEAIDARIRGVLDSYAKLQVPAGELADDDDLYRLGLTSHASVSIMLALEDAFEVEFTDDLLRKGTFQSIVAIRNALIRVGVSGDPI
ncbi:acyl carrier protein [Humibacter sp.]|uniref:acyl carrier protein n=1 Tax=Humibacter sp. TaxID=1940291 RepID=UPI003F80FA39